MAVDSFSRTARFRSHIREPLYRSAYALSISALASAGLGALYWALAANLYDRTIVGVSSAAVAALTFVSGVSGLYLDGSLYRFLPRAGRQTRTLLVATAALTLLGAIAASGIFLAGVPLWAPSLEFLRSSPWTILGCVLTTAASSLLVLQDAALAGLRRAGWVPVKNLAYSAAKIVALFACLGAAARFGILLAWAVPTVLAAAVVSYLFAKRLIPQYRLAEGIAEERLEPRAITRYAAGNYMGYLCTLAYRNLPPLIVLHQAGAAVAAVFYPPWLIVTSLSLLVTNMSVALVIEGTYDRERLGVHIRQASLQTARIVLPIVAFLVLLAPYALRIFGSEYAAGGGTLLRLLALTLIPSSVCILGFGVARIRDRVRVIIVNQVVLAGLGLGLSAVLIDRFGVEGVAIAFLVAYSVVGAVLLLVELLPGLRLRESEALEDPA